MRERPRELGREFKLHVSLEPLRHPLQKKRPRELVRDLFIIQVEQLSKPPNRMHTSNTKSTRGAHLAPLAAVPILSAAISPNRIRAKQLKIAKHPSIYRSTHHESRTEDTHTDRTRIEDKTEAEDKHRERMQAQTDMETENSNSYTSEHLGGSEAIDRGMLLQSRVKVFGARTGGIYLPSASPYVLRIPRKPVTRTHTTDVSRGTEREPKAGRCSQQRREHHHQNEPSTSPNLHNRRKHEAMVDRS